MRIHPVQPSRFQIVAAISSVLIGVSCYAAPAKGGLQTNPSNPVTAPSVATVSISAITLERRCFGCDAEIRVTLKRDGAAEKVAFGNARRGVAERRFTGSVSAAQFDELARAVIAEGFFQLADTYRDLQLADGESATTTVVFSEGQKTVLNRNRIGPAALRRVEQLIENAGNNVAWQPPKVE